MTLEQMRSKIASVYNSPKWIARVSTMPENQIVAIYYSFERSGKFEKKPTLRKKSNSGRQLTIFDFMEGDKR